MTVHSASWPPGKLTTSELTSERAELERRLGDDTLFAAPGTRERWCERLTAIRDEQSKRTEAERQSRADAVAAARRRAAS